MKKNGAVFMAVVMMMSLCACGNNATGQTRESAADDGQTEIGQEEKDGAKEPKTAGKTDINDTEGNDTGNLTAVPIPEEFVLIQGGTFQMGSPEEEAWRSEDEVRHTVTVSDFYMSHGNQFSKKRKYDIM